MKKVSLLSFFAIALLSSELQGQIIRSYGIKGGLVRSGQTWDLSQNASGLLLSNDKVQSIGLGGYIEWMDIPIVSVVTEANYYHKGSNLGFQSTSVIDPAGIGVRTVSPWLGYLSLPLMVKIRYDMPLGDIYILGGIRYDILIDKNRDAEILVMNQWKSTDFGYNIGAGIELPIAFFHNIGIEIRYSTGLQEIYSSSDISIKNSATEMLLVFGL